MRPLTPILQPMRAALPVQFLLPDIENIARQAGELALASFRYGERTTARVWSKAGNSPVTEADVAVDAFLRDHLTRALPEAAWLSEETADHPARLGNDLVWIVDPIDGTRAFLGGQREWSVSIGLISRGRPVLGIVFAPALDLLYGAALGGGAVCNGACLRAPVGPRQERARVAGPKPLIDAIERRSGPVERLPRVPSLALRLARVAEGSIDIGLVSANSHDWDLAGADAILTEAGARLTDLTGAPLRYNRPEPIHGELVAASSALHSRVLEALKS